MRRIAPLLVLAAALLPAAAAQAGGWATVELDAPPAGVSAGEPFEMQLLVKQHGRTPLDGLTPSVRISNDDGVVRTFPARPAGRPGWYEATVTYPSAGTWQTRLFDGFTDATPHRLAPLEVATADGATAPSTAAVPVADQVGSRGDDGRFPWPQAIAIACFAALWLAAWLAVSGAAGRYFPAR